MTADQQDFTAELTQIKALNPEVIYFGGLTPIGVRIRSQMDKLGIKARVRRHLRHRLRRLSSQGLGPLAEGTLAFREGAPTEKLPGGKFFMEKYNAQKYDNPPEAYGPFAYAAMDLILDTIEKVGPDRKKVIADARQREGPRFDRRQDHLRRSRPEHGAGDHQIRDPGRQVGRVGGQRIRHRQAQAAGPEIADRSGGARARRPRFSLTSRHKNRRHGCGLFAQYVMNGLMLGMMYALVAVGFTLFFGVLDVIKFSHGDVLTVGAFAALATYIGLMALGVAIALARSSSS